MSLARAFTKRIKRTDEALSPRAARSNGRFAAGTIDVSKISSPITLLSTTNVHALNAPDIHKSASPESASSSAASTHSGNDSDFSTIDRSFLSNGDSISSPGTPSTPPMEPSTGFFSSKPVDTPTLPQRSPSHSKKAHVELSRQRSVQRMSPPPTSIARANSVRDSAGSKQESIMSPTPHPFGAELAKVNEVAEEFGASSAVLSEEEQFMLHQGLCKFDVQDYLDEIAGLYGGVYEDQLGMAGNPWI